MTDTTQHDDATTTQTPVAGSAQGGAFGGQPYDPNASTESADDFVLDMDDIPDFSLDDLGEDIVEETPSAAVAPVSTEPAPAPAAPETPTPTTPVEALSEDSFDLGSLEESTEPAPAPTIESSPKPTVPAPSPAADVDFDLHLDDVVEEVTPAPSVPEVTTVTDPTPVQTTPAEPVGDIDFDLGDLTEDVTTESVPTDNAPVDDAVSGDSVDDFDLTLDTVTEDATPVETPSPAISTDDSSSESTEEVVDDFDLGDIVEEDTPAVAAVSDVDDVVEESAPVAVTVPTVAASVAVSSPVIEVPDDVSALGQKVGSLMQRVAEAQSLLDEPVRVLGASHDREQVHYEFSIDDDQALTVMRDAVDGDDTVTKTDLTLSFVGSDLAVRLDDVLVFDESHDDALYQKYTHTIAEKIGKFGMHVDDYIAGVQEKIAAKAATQKIKQAGKQLQAF